MPRTLRYKRTKIGLIKEIYDSQKSNSKQGGMNQPTYPQQELIDWAFSQKCFHEIYDKWKSSNYEHRLRPSCDRIDNSVSYTLDNLRIITLGDNLQQVHEDQKSGIDNRMNKPIAEIDDNGYILKMYHSTRFAERELGFGNDSIGKVCRGERKQIYGRRFMYI